MASDDECYDYYDEDEEGLLVDEDDVGLLEDEEALPEFRADHWAITRKSLSTAQQQELSMVMTLVNLEPHNARALLMHHRWKMDRITDFLERRGRDGLFKEAGIMVPPEENNTAFPFGTAADKGAHKRSRIATCNVCFDDVSQLSDVSTMDCGHCFCNDCWTEHFLVSLDSGRKHIHCMEVKCPAICDDATVRRLLGLKYPAAAKRFDGFVLESYLENNAAVKWCPSAPHCGRAIRVDATDASDWCCEVECPCGVSFCFNCAAPAHSPVPCSMWDKWDAKFRGESENLKWIQVNTKSCPGCLKPIEKNGGCNHVSCPCGTYLCYACGGKLDASHNCNRYDEKTVASYDAIRRQMLRFTHYCDRFNVHAASRKGEQEGTLWPSILKRILQLESAPNVRPLNRDASWLARAYHALLASRLVLSRSYAFAYYMFGDEVRTRPADRASLAMGKELFENQQEQLERNAERLSKVLATEAPTVLEEDQVVRTMQETVNLAKIVDSHCREMYTCIQDELLPLLLETMNIAPYRPNGPDKAKDLPA
ncbi:probable E3 ubiquitin-protein ligase ARI1 [Lolium rigidum]|uniref:probable E3 ubiquitin-protein ligase ARI1 n=1 Tax=Lolium rigidum TaxID=89674 RepID=UPI001F5DD409|nr:probable E3 ubiquitin-protein ligase ARI1 [Lolium rigidum]